MLTSKNMKTFPKAPPREPAVAPAHSRPRVDSHQLLRGGQVLEIQHGGQSYLLRVTRENKLILTK